MAKENIQKFFEAASKNEDLQKQVSKITDGSEFETVKAQVEAMAKLAKEAGFDFTAEEFMELVSQSDKKINIDELDAVAGGGGFVDFWKNVGEFFKDFGKNWVKDLLEPELPAGSFPPPHIFYI